MNEPDRSETAAHAVGTPLDCGVGRPELERASACGLTECAGKPACESCKTWREETSGWPRSKDERHLRRLLAVRVGMPHTYYDDGEAQGQEHGISIDFMREPVADIDAKLRALNVARLECSKPSAALPQHVCGLHGFGALGDSCPACKTPNVI